MFEVGVPSKFGRKCKYKTRRIKSPATRWSPLDNTRNRNATIRTGALYDFPNTECFPRDKLALASVVYYKGKPARTQTFGDRPDAVFSRALVISPIPNGHPTVLGPWPIFFFFFFLFTFWATKGSPGCGFRVDNATRRKTDPAGGAVNNIGVLRLSYDYRGPLLMYVEPEAGRFARKHFEHVYGQRKVEFFWAFQRKPRKTYTKAVNAVFHPTVRAVFNRSPKGDCSWGQKPSFNYQRYSFHCFFFVII